MPKLPTFQDLGRAPRDQPAPVPSVPNTTGIGLAVANLGQGLSAAAEVIHAGWVDARNAEASSAMSRFQADITIQVQESIRNVSPENVEGSAGRFISEHRARGEEIVAGFADNKARSVAGNRLNLIMSTATASALEFEFKETKRQSLISLENGFNQGFLPQVAFLGQRDDLEDDERLRLLEEIIGDSARSVDTNSALTLIDMDTENVKNRALLQHELAKNLPIELKKGLASPGFWFEQLDSLPFEDKVDVAEGAAEETKTNIVSMEKDALASFEFYGEAPNAPTLEDYVVAYGEEDGGVKWLDFVADAEVGRLKHEFSTSTPEAIEGRLESLEPPLGTPDFARKATLFERASSEAEKLLKARKNDPAAAVSNFPIVRAAAAAADPNNPDSMVVLISARLLAQAVLDVPELGRQPLPKEEALKLSVTFTSALGLFDQAEALEALIPEIQEKYGVYADEVVRQILQLGGADRDLAIFGARLIRNLGVGEPPTLIEGRKGDLLSDTANANKAVTGEGIAPAIEFRTFPNGAQIQRLLDNPEFAEDFDEKFGAGTADFYLEIRRRREARNEGFTPDQGEGESFTPPEGVR